MARPSKKHPDFGPAENALRKALESRDEERVAAALQAPVNVEARSSDGFTLLSWAAYCGSPLAVQELLARGGDPNFQPRKGMNAALWTTFILARTSDADRAASLLEVLRLLVAAGTDVERANCRGWRPLAAAIGANGMEAIPLLLGGGAKVNGVDKEKGRSALHGAAAKREGGQELAALLLDAGADLFLKDLGGKTPLDLATPEMRIFFEQRHLATEVAQGRPAPRPRV